MLPWGLCPQTPGIFGGMNSGDHLGGEERPRGHGWTRGAEYLVVHRRPGYPLVGCVPAEPASVSSGHGKVTKRFATNKRNLADRSREAGQGSVSMNPGGSILRADVGPICAPITNRFLVAAGP